MAFLPTQNLSTTFEQYPGYWLKFYTQGTTSPISMATDAAAGTLLAKAVISSGGAVDIGFLKTDGGEIFQPYINEAYDAFLFPTESEADVNDTTNAIKIADNVDLQSSESTLSAQFSKVFDTVADMVAATTLNVGESAQTLGYRSSSDGGGNTYNIVGAGTGTDDSGSFIDLAAHQAQGTFPRRNINVNQFGAIGDGATDDASNIQAAINYVELTGGVLKLLAHTYRINTALTIDNHNVKILGMGVVSKIETSSATLDIFIVKHSSGSEIDNIIFENFSVWSSVIKTAGDAFNCEKTARCYWDRVFIGAPEDVVAVSENRIFNGIDLDQFDYCVVTAGHITSINEGIACNGNSSNGFGAGLFLDGGLKIQSQDTGAAVHIGGGAGGVYFNNMDIIDNFYNVQISTLRQPGTPNREIFFGATCSLDSAKQAGILVNESSITHLDLTGTWIASAGASNTTRAGIEITTPNTELKLNCTGVRFFNNRGGGVVANAGNLIFSGCTILSNGAGSLVTLGNGLGNGIWVSNTDVIGLEVTGCVINNNGNASASAGFGIKTLTIANILIANNTFVGNIQRAVDYSGAYDFNKIVRDNVGYVTSNVGDSTITNTNTSVTVTHGLTPDRGVRILITPVGNFPESGTYFSSSAGTVTFDLNLGGTATRNNDFHWSAISI